MPKRLANRFLASKLSVDLLRKNPKLFKAGHFAARHPIMVPSAMFSASMGYRNAPGSNRSRRNQADPYLRRIRAHQQSSAITGLMGNSMGGMTL